MLRKILHISGKDMNSNDKVRERTRQRKLYRTSSVND